MNNYQTPSLQEVQLLLHQNNLPTNDIADLNLDHYHQMPNAKGVVLRC
jgi:hypothetical protein